MASSIPPPEPPSGRTQSALGETYGGFAVDPPRDAADGAEGQDGDARTYLNSEYRRRPRRRRGLSPTVAGGAAACVVAVGAALGVAWSGARQPSQFAPEPVAADLRAAVLRPAPVARIDAPEPVAVLPPDPVAAAAPVADVAPRPAPKRLVPTAKGAGCGADCQARIAALDREVNQAFADAMRSGVDPGPLGAAQQDWIIRRDRVRRTDPALAEDLYRARIVELQAMGGEAEPVEPDEPVAAPPPADVAG